MSTRLTEEDLKGIEAHMGDHLREAAESHMDRLIAEVRWYLATREEAEHRYLAAHEEAERR